MSCHGIYSIIQERNLERTLICLFPSTSTMWKFLWSDPSSPFLLPLCGPVLIVFHLAWFITLKSIFYSIAVLSYSAVSDSLWPHGLKPARLLCPWGFSRQEYWSELPCPPPGDLPNPDLNWTQARPPNCSSFFTVWATGKPWTIILFMLIPYLKMILSPIVCQDLLTWSTKLSMIFLSIFPTLFLVISCPQEQQKNSG